MGLVFWVRMAGDSLTGVLISLGLQAGIFTFHTAYGLWTEK